MKKTINVTLAIEVDTVLESIDDTVNSLLFSVNPDDEMVVVERTEVIDFFEV
jgi:hypothetical protein